MTKNKVVRFAREGGPEVLELHTLEVPPPAASEVRVRVEAIGLNRAEAMYRGGYYYERAERYPAILGYEGAGTIDALGPDVRGFEPGEPVSIVPAFSMRDYGVYAELANVPAHAIVRRPEGQSAADGAAVWMSGITAYGALLEVGKLRAGDTVLLTAASGSIGLTAIEIANRIGARSIACTRNPAKRDALLRAGATHVIVGSDNLVAQVRDLTDGRGAELVFDAVAGPGVNELAAATASDGMLLLYGFLEQPEVAGTFGTLATPFPLTNWTCNMRWYAAAMDVSARPDRLRRAREFVLSGIRHGTLKATIDRTFPLDQIAAAHAYLESNAQVGKVVVTVP